MNERRLEWEAERRFLEEQKRRIERRLAELGAILNAFREAA